MVVAYLQEMGRTMSSFSIEHRSALSTPDGEFVMDGVARFEMLGAEFVVLIECKHHKNPIKRELVQVLADKLSSAHAQKGMLFSTAPFQKGAIEYALSHQIALVHLTEGGPVYLAKAEDGPRGPNRPYEAYWVRLSDSGTTSYWFGHATELADELFTEGPSDCI
jgi:restriction system protein